MGEVQPGWVVWITGLAGAGKTTISREVCQVLRERSPAVFRLDSDEFRAINAGDLGYGLADRLENARRLSRLAKIVSDQGIHVVVATISLFHECHDWNRANLPRYLEVLLQVSQSTLEERNQKNLYSKESRDVMGVHQVPEFPKDPDLMLQNGPGAPGVRESAEQIVDRLLGLEGPLEK